MNQSGASGSRITITGTTTAKTVLRFGVRDVSWRSQLARDGGEGRAGFIASAEMAQVVDDAVGVRRGSARGEDSVRPDEREAAAEISVDDVDELGVALYAGRLERAADAGAGHDQQVASAAEQVMQPGRPVLATDLEVGE